MKRDGRVARTSKGLDHVNRLRFPAFRIVNLQFKAGTAESKPHFPPGTPDVPDTGSDDFHFIPQLETIEFHYEIDDSYAMVDGGKLEFYNRFEEDPLWSLDLKTLGADWIAHGRHVVNWDGRTVKPAAEQKATVDAGVYKHDLTKIGVDKTIHASFPDGYLTLEHPPYKVRLTLTTDADDELKTRPVRAWTYFHILVKGIELALGDKEAVPAATVNDERHKADKAVRERIEADGGLTAGDAIRKVFLISNIYKTSGNEMETDTAFDELKAKWSDGPNIPIYAKIRLLSSSDAEVKMDESAKGAVALGKTRFMWDWEDPDEDVNAQQGQPAPKAFIEAAINFDKNTTEPKGDNCHIDRGGKRGPNAKPVFPKQDGYDPKDTLDDGKFPFKVFAADSTEKPVLAERKWAAFSLGWTSGKLKGMTGAVFQPSRMAGDNYKVVVYVAFDRDKKDHLTLDAKTQPLVAPADIKKSTGVFQIWRELHLSRYIRKNATITAFLPANLPAVQAYYSEVYTQIEDKMGADNQYTLDDHETSRGAAIDYNQICENLFTSSGNALYSDHLAPPASADHASVDSAFLVRDYGAFVKHVHTHLDAAGAGDFDAMRWDPEGLGARSIPPVPSGTAPNMVAEAARINRLTATQNWLQANRVDTKFAYAGTLDDQLCTFIETSMTSTLRLISGGKSGVNQPAAEGVTVIHFNYTNTYLRDQLASSANMGSIYGSAVDPTDASRSKCAFLYLSPRVDTFAHEIGHHLFLPHTIDERGPARLHDDADRGCLMSYNRPRPSFCGFCQLRLRGWTSTALSKTAASNQRT